MVDVLERDGLQGLYSFRSVTPRFRGDPNALVDIQPGNENREVLVEHGNASTRNVYGAVAHLAPLFAFRLLDPLGEIYGLLLLCHERPDSASVPPAHARDLDLDDASPVRKVPVEVHDLLRDLQGILVVRAADPHVVLCNAPHRCCVQSIRENVDEVPVQPAKSLGREVTLVEDVRRCARAGTLVDHHAADVVQQILLRHIVGSKALQAVVVVVVTTCFLVPPPHRPEQLIEASHPVYVLVARGLGEGFFADQLCIHLLQ
mmetsp:Transcript_49365/g.141217  ORF Transcript_49365/g.141217 Transcript_49365/m.141217 type:complete len:260 (-) Transcript_49365:993-1772(-)